MTGRTSPPEGDTRNCRCASRRWCPVHGPYQLGARAVAAGAATVLLLLAACTPEQQPTDQPGPPVVVTHDGDGDAVQGATGGTP
ncbi:hypothetical protein [Streptomyces sp. SBT349]|uniref:hypothetical protein n=1 Tax=Streptomyces sp. SBT349 TaxID=1580539 RepID=UPI00066E542F|nr:hypothetical protein [Streptomyces sp. SBT349]